MVFLRVTYYLIVIIAATAGLMNTLQLRRHDERINAVERVRQRVRDRLMRSDETAPDIDQAELIERLQQLEAWVRAAHEGWPDHLPELVSPPPAEEILP